MSGNEDDWQDRTALDEKALQLEAAQSRHLHVEQDASRRFGARQAIQQLFGRRIRLDIVTRPFEPAFDRPSIRGIVIYHVNKARQSPLLAVKSKRSRYLCSITLNHERKLLIPSFAPDAVSAPEPDLSFGTMTHQTI